MDGLQGLDLDVNPKQLAAVMAMINGNQRIMERRPRDEEDWYDMGDISMLEHYHEGIGINNSKDIITTIGNRFKLGEILKDVRLGPYESWGKWNSLIRMGYRELFLHWEIGHTNPVLFALADKKHPCANTSFGNKVCGEFWIGGSPCRGNSSVCQGMHRAEGANSNTNTYMKPNNNADGDDGAEVRHRDLRTLRIPIILIYI